MSENPYLPEWSAPPEPPAILYKYVAPERIDVLEGGRIRYTPLLGTNDVFEVRRTFKSIIGPKAQKAFLHTVPEIDIDDILTTQVQKALGLDAATAKMFGQAALMSQLGPDWRQHIEAEVQHALTHVLIPMANTDAAADNLLHNLGSDLLALSLTEDSKNPAMWAHYAADWHGFVIGFDTSARFLRNGSSSDPRVIHKVQYFDGVVDELLELGAQALISKTTHWSYESEWRSYIRESEADHRLELGGSIVHLRNFAPEAVKSILVGRKASAETVERLRTVIVERYPHATLARLVRVGFSDHLIDEPI